MKDVFQTLGPAGFDSYEVNFEEENISFSLTDIGDAKRILVPGFIDIHIHGAFGIDFMSASGDELLRLCQGLEERGYEGFLPTTVTADASSVLSAVSKLPDHPMILGFHLEGPFISAKHPGAQPSSFIEIPPTGPSEWDPVLDHPKLKVATLAPELAGAPALIARLVSNGAKVGMGHTDATYAEATKGLAAGVSHSTHTYNAMRPFHHREAGTVGFALMNDLLACELIYDRLHVCREAAALLINAKPKDKVVGISDGTKAAGLPQRTKLDMWGQSAEVGAGDVRLDSGALAGSAVTLDRVFQNLWEDFGPEVAIRACCLNPRNLLGMPNQPRRWLILDRNLALQDVIG